MRILVDMDGVLADFETAFLTQWKQRHPEKPYISLEERSTFYLHEQYPLELRDLVPEIYCAPNFFRSLAPIPGGKAALHEMKAMGCEVFICTSPLLFYENCVLEKFQWIEDVLGREWTLQI